MTQPPKTGPSLEHPLSGAELRAYETRLRHDLADLRAGVESIESGILAASGGDRGQQPDDEGLEEEALHAERARLEADDEIAYQVREALQRLREGTFGTCTTCGRFIGRERLEVVPYTASCASCAALEA